MPKYSINDEINALLKSMNALDMAAENVTEVVDEAVLVAGAKAKKKYVEDLKRKSENHELLDAIHAGDHTAVKDLLERGADVTGGHSFDIPLNVAAQNGNADIVRLLLDHGAPINEKPPLGGTALIDAAQEGHVETVRLLIGRGADLDEEDGIGETALEWAKLRRHKEIVRMMKDAPKLRKQTAEQEAAKTAVDSLLADTLSGAVAAGDCQKVRDIFDQKFWGKDPVSVRWEHLKTALGREDRPMMRLLITWGATAPDEKRALLTAKETSLLRQCGLRITPSVSAEAKEPEAEKPETINPIEMIPQEWLTVLNALQSKGGTREAVIAGGALRDTFNGRAVKDVDIFLQSRGDTKKNKKLLQTAFQAAKLSIVKQPEWSDSYEPPKYEAFPKPKSRTNKLYKTSYDGGYGSYSFLTEDIAESWTVIAGPQKTEYNIIFTGGPVKKVPGIIYPIREEVPDPPADFAEQLIKKFDFGICQIAYNGEKFFATPVYQEDMKGKQMTLVQSNPGTPEHQARLLQKYPEWAIRKPSAKPPEKKIWEEKLASGQVVRRETLTLGSISSNHKKKS